MKRKNKRKPSANDIIAYRRKRKRRSALPKIIAFLAALCVVIAAAANAPAIFAPFKGIVSKFGNTKRGPAGYPVRLPGSAGYDFRPYDDGFMLLTDTYLYVYAADGSLIQASQHGYANPRVSAGQKRILILDRNNRAFALYGRSGDVFKKTPAEKIVYGAAGENDSSAVVLKGSGYANVIEIYDGKGQWRYRRRFLDEHVMQIAFTDADKDIVVTALGFDSGDDKAAVYRFATDREDDEVWKCDLPDNSLPLALYADEDNVFILCDGHFLAIDAKAGVIKGSYRFSGSAADFAFSKEVSALLIDDYTAGAMLLVTLDGSANQIAETEVSGSPYQIGVYAGEISLLGENGIALYGADLTENGFIPISEEYSRFIRIGDAILALGYDKIDKIQ